MTNNLTPVILVEENVIVMLPMDNALVLRQGATFKIQGFDGLFIEDNDYHVLRNDMGLPDIKPEHTTSFIADRIIKAQADNEVKLSAGAAAWIAELMVWGGDGIQEIVESLPTILPNFYEGTIKELAEKFNVALDGLDEEAQEQAVMEAIEDGDDTVFEKSYAVGDEWYLLYRKCPSKAAITADGE